MIKLIIPSIENAAFDSGEELPRIFERIAEQLRAGYFDQDSGPTSHPIKDINGNTIGTLSFSD